MFDLTGKKVLIMGVANKDSLAYGIAKAARGMGATVYLSYQNETLLKRIKPIQTELGIADIIECDVTIDSHLVSLAEYVGAIGPIDALVHSIAFAGREQLQGPYLKAVTKEGFVTAMTGSCWSFTSVIQHLLPHLAAGASLMTLTFYASSRVWANYNVMAQAKSALECSVRTLATELGPLGIRVNAISASPARTLAASGIAHDRRVGGIAEAMSPLGRLATKAEIGGVGAYLMADISSCFTGVVFPANCGVEITAHAPPWNAGKMAEEMELVEKIDHSVIGAEREGINLNIAKRKKKEKGENDANLPPTEQSGN